jgi:hypothetical protein
MYYVTGIYLRICGLSQGAVNRNCTAIIGDYIQGSGRGLLQVQ